MSSDVTIKGSRIHEKGVFANRNFKKGETIFKWDTNHVLALEQVGKLHEKEKRYVTGYLQGKYLLLQPPERYVNHSCSANTSISDFCDVAKRGIAKGEEITGDYSDETIPWLEFKCNCGEKNCRGTVIGKGK